MMRSEEVDYWNDVANVKGVKDNTWKRCAEASRVLKHIPVKTKILEIGCGQGAVASLVNLATLGNIEYLGTDLSDVWCFNTENQWNLPTVQASIVDLPGEGYDMIWAFDTLEHVHPMDRIKGYKEIGRVIKTPGLVLLNIPLDESQHVEQFDWGFTQSDLSQLCVLAKLKMSSYEAYTIEQIGRSYVWAELVRLP